MREQQRRICEQQQEGAELGQQVRLAREGLQCGQLEITETRQQLAAAQEESDRLTDKLKAMELLSREEVKAVPAPGAPKLLVIDDFLLLLFLTYEHSSYFRFFLLYCVTLNHSGLN